MTDKMPIPPITEADYKKIMSDLGMPESRSLLFALRQVANHAAQYALQQAAQSPELERLRKDAGKVLHAEQIRIAAVAAIREVTGCPDLKGKDGAYLVDTLIVNLLEMQSCRSIAAEREKK